MKRSALKWCALAMAIMLIGSNMVYQVSSSISAHEAEQVFRVEQEARNAAAQAAQRMADEASEDKISAEALVKDQQHEEHTDDNCIEVTELSQ